MPERIPGIIVTCFPDADFEVRLRAIAMEMSPVLVVDNSADVPTAARLAAICGRCGCQLLINAGNLGIAAALNRGFREVERLGSVWAIALDQDSTSEPGLVRCLLECARRFSTTKAPAVVGANWFDEGRPDHPSLHLKAHPACRLLFQRVPAHGDLADVTCVINSGSLFHLPTWRALGGFDDSLFLDLVDTDYCLRARQAGHRVCVSACARLRHHRGSKRPVEFLGRTWWPAFMPPRRLYYLFRNRLLLFRKYAWRAPHWAAFEIAFALKIIAEILFLEDHTFVKLGACLRGTRAGVLGRRGAPIASAGPASSVPGAGAPPGNRRSG
jgi:rhamnosyltransferase